MALAFTAAALLCKSGLGVMFPTVIRHVPERYQVRVKFIRFKLVISLDLLKENLEWLASCGLQRKYSRPRLRPFTGSLGQKFPPLSCSLDLTSGFLNIFFRMSSANRAT